MDDLQFRRLIYADPNSCDEQVLEAKKSDPAKQKFAHEISEFNKKIHQAMKIDVPDDLYNKLILRQTLVTHNQQKRKHRIQLAMAASVAFVLGLTLNFMQPQKSYNDLGNYALAHTKFEAHLFDNNSNAHLSLASLNEKMASYNGSFTHSFGKLISSGYCDFGNIKALHLVYQGKIGPVMVYVIPNNHNLTFDKNFADSSLHGEAQQYKNADIIVVGDKKEPLKTWKDNINKNIHWST